MGNRRTGILGEQAERTAFEFLVRQGLTPISRNYRRRGGEIDLIMLHGDCLAFIEVRYRSSRHFSNPELTIDSRKQQKIIRTAAFFVAGQRRYAGHTMRFDVVGVIGADDAEIRWIPDAFRPADSTL